MDTKDNQVLLEEETLENRFQLRSGLINRKIREYFPALVMTNLSTFLLLSVDSLVVGNLVSSEALSSVNIFYPASLMVGVISCWIAVGASTILSTGMGRSDVEAIPRLKAAGLKTLFIAAIFNSLIQIPIVYLIIASYHLSPEMNKLVWAYGIGVMVATPFGMFSNMGVYQLQIIGKMKVLMVLSAIEGVSNVVFDLFFVQVMHLGVAGAGYGTACANIVRCTVTVIYLVKKTDMYNCEGAKATWADIKEILVYGLPDALNSLMLALQNYFMIQIILSSFGDDGGVIKGVCTFCFNIIFVVMTAIQGSARPLTGMMVGAKATEGLRILMRQCGIIMAVLIGAVSVVMLLLPGWFYHLHGVETIPDGGILALRIYVLFFVFKGLDTLLRLYFTNRKDSKFVSTLTIVGNATLPLFALLLVKVIGLPPAWLWLSYLLMELVIFIPYVMRYRWWVHRDATEEGPDVSVLNMSMQPEDAVEASRMLRDYAKAHDYPMGIANRVALCLEEMVAYSVKLQEDNKVTQLIKGGLKSNLTENLPDNKTNDFLSGIQEELNDNIEMQIMIRLTKEDGLFMMIDDGKCLALDKNKHTRALITDNYDLIRRISKSMEYQYLLNLNYTIVRF